MKLDAAPTCKKYTMPFPAPMGVGAAMKTVFYWDTLYDLGN